jgi:two-component system nitrogen regulation sensor histidine kinase NtrY
MRLRFAISGHAPKAETKQPEPEKKAKASETAEAVDATNSETKIAAATSG